MTVSVYITCFNIELNLDRLPLFLLAAEFGSISSSEDVLDFLFLYRCWIRCDMASNFKAGALPSSTNTGLTPRRSRHDVRKNKFLQESIYS